MTTCSIIDGGNRGITDMPIKSSADDLLEPAGTSAQTLDFIGISVIPRFPPSIIEQVVINAKSTGGGKICQRPMRS
jgi:hypothetical protein